MCAPRIAIIAGEPSGDRLGGALIEAIRERAPGARFFGMRGPHMAAAGCEALADIEELSVMGLVEVLRSYPRLLRLRRRLVERIVALAPDAVVGIDVPDFNLGLERRVRARGIATVHYVCPQAWAWRPGRARRLAQSADRLLALLPFEPAFFDRYGVTTEFVGHPLADALPLEPARAAARQVLDIAAERTVIALMPGSRGQEMSRLAAPFAAAAALLRRERPGIEFIACAAREHDAGRLREAFRGLPCRVFSGRSGEVLSAADVALAASGTVTLEALLCATPVVVGYRLAPLSYHIIRRMVRIPRIALPNILTGEDLVPELLQQAMTPAALAAAAAAWLDDEARCAAYRARSREIHRTLRRDAAACAARSVLELAGHAG